MLPYFNRVLCFNWSLVIDISILSGFIASTATGDKSLEDKDAILSAFKRIERNIHDHHHHGHGHGEHGHGHHENDGVDLLDFFQQVGVRLTDGKDREGADDLGNGTVPKKRIYYFWLNFDTV